MFIQNVAKHRASSKSLLALKNRVPKDTLYAPSSMSLPGSLLGVRKHIAVHCNAVQKKNMVRDCQNGSNNIMNTKNSEKRSAYGSGCHTKAIHYSILCYTIFW